MQPIDRFDRIEGTAQGERKHYDQWRFMFDEEKGAVFAWIAFSLVIFITLAWWYLTGSNQRDREDP